jgi:hypothetical protein
MPLLTSARAALAIALVSLAACGGTHNETASGGGGTSSTTTVTSSTSSTSSATGAGGSADCAEVTLTHGPAAAPADALVHLVDLSAHPDAVCNDGTPAAYVLRPGNGPAAKRWLIYLEGGGECATSDDCLARSKSTPGLMSNAGVVDGAAFGGDLGGIKSTSPTVNPDFYDATIVQLQYCSSDGWTGDRAGDPSLPTSDARHWHFRGRKIVEAVLADLGGRGLTEASDVLLLGSSAGGVGVFNNADDVRDALPAGVRFAALTDAGFILDYPAYDPATGMESTATPSPREAELAAAVALWGGRGDASCEAAAADDASRALCRSPTNLALHGHITAPLLIRQSQLDPIQLKQLIDPSQKDTAAKAFRQRFAAAMRATLAQTPAQVWVFSTTDAHHGVVNDDTTWTGAVVDGTRLPAAVHAFYEAPCAPAVKLIEGQ